MIAFHLSNGFDHVCASDVDGVDGSTGQRVPPIIMGHEAAGEIVATGARVTGWEVGERVAFGCVLACGRLGPDNMLVTFSGLAVCG